MFKHGHAGLNQITRLYRVWQWMRLTTATDQPRIKHYSSGFEEYAPWKDFRVFRDWALSNGYKDNLKLGRIDPRKGFSPDNCRFQTSSVCRAVMCLETGEVFLSMSEAARKTDCDSSNILRSVKTGMATAGLHWKALDPQKH